MPHMPDFQFEPGQNHGFLLIRKEVSHMKFELKLSDILVILSGKSTKSGKDYRILVVQKAYQSNSAILDQLVKEGVKEIQLA